MKNYVKIDRKVLFQILDEILSYDGGFKYNDCPENDSPYFTCEWNENFLKKIKNIRNNS